jgi:hypothetical protein
MKACQRQRVFTVVVAMAMAGCATIAAGADSIRLDKVPLLFADDSGIFRSTGVERRFHPGRSLPEPVLIADRPWEGERVYIYGAVMRDDERGGFRVWYQGRPQQEVAAGRSRSGLVPGMRNAGFDLVLHATSEDGIAWNKPALDLHAYAGTRSNNIVFDLHSPSVIIDPFTADPAQRYKMLGALSHYPGPGEKNYYAAHSADGIRWHSYPINPVLAHADTVTLTQNPHTGEFLAFHKCPADIRGFPRRVVWLARSMDFQDWSEPELVLAPDAIDDAWTSGPEERTEIYNMSVFPHAAGYIGWPTIFHVTRQLARTEAAPGQSPLDGPIDVQLATSRDGRAWQRPHPRAVMIPRGPPGTYNAGAILGVATAPVDVGDASWLYYTAISTGHGGPLPAKQISIGRASWRLHGYASLNAGPDGGHVVTRPVLLGRARLVLNADASRGRIRVGLTEADGTPIAGYGLQHSVALRTDATRWQVRWENEDSVPMDRPVRIEMEMRSAALFSLSTLMTND